MSNGSARSFAPATSSRGPATRELAMILPDTDAHGGVGAVARARAELAELGDVALTVGDLRPRGRQGTRSHSMPLRIARLPRRVATGVGGTVQFSTAFELAS